jgi:competence protein J (ComJ)
MPSEASIYSGTIYFSYGQFYVFDRAVNLPGCVWTEPHYKQGFARRERNVSFGTLVEFGHGDVTVYLGPYKGRSNYERVIEVPIEVLSGEVVVGGPEEHPNQHIVKLPGGYYRLVAAQTVTGDDREAIDLYFEKLAKPLAHSRILVADHVLDPASPLLESVEIA